MSPREPSRTQDCGLQHARVRLRQAKKYLEVAEVAAGESAVPESATAAVANAVLGGIAASDAACCAALGRRARDQDHVRAAELLGQVADPANLRPDQALRRLLGFTDSAHYGMSDLSGQNVQSALRLLRRLISFAESVLAR